MEPRARPARMRLDAWGWGVAALALALALGLTLRYAPGAFLGPLLLVPVLLTGILVLVVAAVLLFLLRPLLPRRGA